MKTKTTEARTPDARGRLKFDPTINPGTIVQVLVVIGSSILAYGSYREDRVRQDGRIGQAEVLVERDRQSMRETLQEIKNRMDALERRHQGGREAQGASPSCVATEGRRK